MNYLENLLDMSLAAAPWLVLGLIVGGFIKAMIPMSFLEKHLGGQGIVQLSRQLFWEHRCHFAHVA